MPGEKCILCNSSDLIVTEILNTDQLIRLYKKRAKVDVSRFFKVKEISSYRCLHCGLGMYLPQAVGDGEFYDDLQKYKGYYLNEKPEFTEAAKFIRSTDDVLEVGSGEGLFVNYINCNSYKGLEFSEEAISKAKSNAITLHKESIEDHAANNKNKYDIVCYFQVLEHVPNPGAFIKASVDCLKPGGKLIVAVPSADSFISDALNFYLNMPPHHTSSWTDQTLGMIAELNQLKVIHIFHEPLHPMHRVFYYKTVIYKRLAGKFRHRGGILDNSSVSWALYALSSFMAHVKNVFPPAGKLPMGQSVSFVYQKPS
jgi:2-polyprenyl-3-methyl-5-hydroxy-6-metoxy-1,4-benzoquinol methylase